MSSFLEYCIINISILYSYTVELKLYYENYTSKKKSCPVSFQIRITWERLHCCLIGCLIELFMHQIKRDCLFNRVVLHISSISKQKRVSNFPRNFPKTFLSQKGTLSRYKEWKPKITPMNRYTFKTLQTNIASLILGRAQDGAVDYSSSLRGRFYNVSL